MDTDESIKTKDSYFERRKLFKNIWDTAIHLNDRDQESVNVNKPKVIKTLRLSDIDTRKVGKTKQQRIKNLRTICTKLLDICNDHEVEQVYDQMTTARQDSDVTSVIYCRPKKKKKVKKKKKTQKCYNYVQTDECKEPAPCFEIKEEDGPVTHRGTFMNAVRSSRMNRATLIQQYLDERFNFAKIPPDIATTSESAQKITQDAHRKVVKKKCRKKKDTVSPITPAASPQIREVPETKKKTRKDCAPLVIK